MKTTNADLAKSAASVRFDLQQIHAAHAEHRKFEAMSTKDLADYAFEHDLEGFKARHHLWQRMAQRLAVN